jgi:ribosomal protein L29
MKPAAIRDMTPREIYKKLDEIERELFALGFQISQQKPTAKIRELRRDRARLLQSLAARGVEEPGTGGRA